MPLSPGPGFAVPMEWVSATFLASRWPPCPNCKNEGAMARRADGTSPDQATLSAVRVRKPRQKTVAARTRQRSSVKYHPSGWKAVLLAASFSIQEMSVRPTVGAVTPCAGSVEMARVEDHFNSFFPVSPAAFSWARAPASMLSMA